MASIFFTAHMPIQYSRLPLYFDSIWISQKYKWKWIYIFLYLFFRNWSQSSKKKKKLSNKVVIFDFFMIFLQAILQQNLKELELIVYIIRLNKLLLMWLFLFTFNLLPGVSFLTTQSFSQTMRPTNIGWDKRRHDYIWSMVKKRSKYFEVLIVS